MLTSGLFRKMRELQIRIEVEVILATCSLHAKFAEEESS